VSYSDKLEEIQRRRAELRALERLAESEARAMNVRNWGCCKYIRTPSGP
jgi:hypothetical protein